MNPLLVVSLLELLIVLASIILFAWLSLPRANPLVVTFRPVWRFFTRRNYFIYAAICLAVIGSDIVLTNIDERFTALVCEWRGGSDFTELIWSIEGSTVKAFHGWTWEPLTWYMCWAYIIVFPAMLPCAMFVFDYAGEKRKNIALLIGYLANYAMMLPFYIFFPVRECHAFRTPDGQAFVPLGLDRIDPAIVQVLRPTSGIDNCFPSFHTSLVVTIALFALSSGRKAFEILMAIMACSVIFSTLYLGIHWASDVIVGIIVGVIAWLVGERLATRFCGRNTTPPTNI